MNRVGVFSIKTVARAGTLIYFIGFLFGYLTRYFTS